MDDEDAADKEEGEFEYRVQSHLFAFDLGKDDVALIVKDYGNDISFGFYDESSPDECRQHIYHYVKPQKDLESMAITS
jgi:hypothetical protein